MAFRFKDKERPSSYVCHCASALHVCFIIYLPETCMKRSFNCFFSNNLHLLFYAIVDLCWVLSWIVAFSAVERFVVTKINTYILSIFLKVQNFMITSTVILAPSVLSTRKNLPLKLTIYENDVENALPWWSAVTS